MSSLFRVDICSQLLDKNPYDEAVWSLKVSATNLRKLRFATGLIIFTDESPHRTSASG